MSRSIVDRARSRLCANAGRRPKSVVAGVTDPGIVDEKPASLRPATALQRAVWPCLLAAIVIVAASTPSHAAVINWTAGAMTDDWSVVDNWNTKIVPTAADTASFDNVGAVILPNEVTNFLTADQTVGGLIYNNTNLYHTTDLGGHTLTVNGNVNFNTNQPGFTITTIRNGALEVDSALSNINVARNLGAGAQAIVDLSLVMQFDANVNTFQVATSTGGGATGELKLSPLNSIEANEVLIGASGGNATLRLGTTNTILTPSLVVGKDFSNSKIETVPGGSLNLGAVDARMTLSLADGNYNTGNNSVYVTSRIDLTSGGALIAYLDGLVVGRKFGIGTNGNTVGQLLAPSTGSVSIGESGNVANMIVGQCMGNDTANGFVDFSGIETFSANLDRLHVGVGNTGSSSGTLLLAELSEIDANSIVFGDSPTGGSATVRLGQINNIQTDELIVSRNLINATVEVGSGGSLELGAADRRVFLSIADHDFNIGAYVATGRMDLTVGSTFNAHLDDLIVARKFGGSGHTVGQLFAPSSGTVYIGEPANPATVIIGQNTVNDTVTGLVDLSGLDSLTAILDELHVGVGTSGSSSGTLYLADANTIDANSIVFGDSPTGGSATVRLGLTNDIQTNELVVSRKFINSTVDITAGGAVELGAADRRAFVSIADHTFNTGAVVVTGRVDLTLGSTLNAYLDDLIVARKFGGSGHTVGQFFAPNSGTVSIGETGNTATVIVGQNTVNDTVAGLVDFSGMDSLTAHLDEMIVGAGSNSGSGTGTLLLAATNEIDATRIAVGDGGSSGGTLRPGQNNTILVDELVVGRGFGEARLEIPSGGTLALGSATQRATLRIAKVDGNLGSSPNSIMDLTGAEVEAWLGDVFIGEKDNQPGGATGTLTIGTDPDNYVNAQAITLGIVKGTGNLNFHGGTLVADSITKGSATGAANFTWTGGTLHVDQYGTPSLPLNLNNSGSGTLSPGESAGETKIFGNYTQGVAATMEIELGGLAQGVEYDWVRVFGTAQLNGTLDLSLFGGFIPTATDVFTILMATSITGQFANAPAGPSGLDTEFGSFDISYTGGKVMLSNFVAAVNNVEGDVDGDGDVDFQDFLSLQAGYGVASGAERSDGDLDGDDDVDFQDFLILQANYGADSLGAGAWASSELESTAVPEPSSAVLALLAIVILLCRGTSKRWWQA